MTATAIKLSNFTVELGNDRCGNFSVPVLNSVYRGTFDKGRLMSRAEGNKDMGQRNNALPHLVPGIQFEINWRKGCVKITDPITPEVLKQIENAKKVGTGTYSLAGVAKCGDVETKLDEHQLKTLARYLVRRCEVNEGKCVNGNLPTEEQLNDAPGRYLYNPNNPNSRPKFEDEAGDYFDKIRAMQ